MNHHRVLTARAQAQALLALILRDHMTFDEALAKAPLEGMEADQRHARLLVHTVLQHLGQIDALIANYLETPLPPKRLKVMNALRLGVAQLVFLNTPAHAAVNETVELVKRGPDAKLSGLVNAVLQRMARETPSVPAPVVNLPLWLRRRWEQAYGTDAVSRMAQVAVGRPPLDIHVCAQSYPLGTPLGHHMVRLPADHDAVTELPGYEEGAFYVQDIAASYPVRLLGDLREHQVLDVCAAPGGKAMQLMRAGAYVTAVDRSAARMKVFKANMKRMNMQANSVTADALSWQPNRMVDAILLDAPCTATGTWRRHPEVVQLVNEAHITEMAALQRKLLTRVWEWLKPGGKLVYCVCSVEPEEGERQAKWFAEHTHDARLMPIDSETTGIPPAAIQDFYLRTTPALMHESGGMDGFFAACFQKC